MDNKLLDGIETREMRSDDPPHNIIKGALWVRQEDVVEALLKLRECWLKKAESLAGGYASALQDCAEQLK